MAEYSRSLVDAIGDPRGGLKDIGSVKKAPAPTGGAGPARRDCFPTRTNLPVKWMLDFDVDQR